MSGIFLESAYYGDEKTFTNITKGLLPKIVGGVLDVTSNSELRPVFEAAAETNLDSKDQRAIREEAVKGCGGESDQSCLERTRLKLSQERLKEKENENLVRGVIKGDRLTVNILDNGKRRTLVAPAGQKLRLENLSDGTRAASNPLPTYDEFQTRMFVLLGVVVSTFIWVFGIVAVYTVFMRQYESTGDDVFRIAAYVSAALSTLIPGLGYIIIIGYFSINAFIVEYKAKPT